MPFDFPSAIKTTNPKSHQCRCICWNYTKNWKIKISEKNNEVPISHNYNSVINSSLKADSRLIYWQLFHFHLYSIAYKTKMLHFMNVRVIVIDMQATEFSKLFISLFHTFTSYCRPYPSHVAVVCERSLYSISHDTFEW